jgi:hypothetical protein
MNFFADTMNTLIAFIILLSGFDRNSSPSIIPCISLNKNRMSDFVKLAAFSIISFSIFEIEKRLSVSMDTSFGAYTKYSLTL